LVTAGSFVPEVNTSSVEIDAMMDAVKAGNGGLEQISATFEKTFGISYKEFVDLYCDSVNGKGDKKIISNANTLDATQMFRRKFSALKDKANPTRKSIINCALSSTMEESLDNGDGTVKIGRCISDAGINRSGSVIQCEDKVLDIKNNSRDLVFLRKHPDLIYAVGMGSSSSLPGCYNIKSLDAAKGTIKFESALSQLPAYLSNSYSYEQNFQKLEFRAHVCRSNSSKSDDSILNDLGTEGRRGGAVNH
jgi:hypothetical protein